MDRSPSTGSKSADFISISDCMERYCIARKTVMKVAKEASALYQYSKCYRVDAKAFDSYFREQFRVTE